MNRRRRTGTGGTPHWLGNHRVAVCEHLVATVRLDDLPPPPADGPAWQDRAAAIADLVPNLEGHLTGAPIGWFALLEHAARVIASHLAPGERLIVDQIKEKYATLRFYAHVRLASGDGDGSHAALGAVDWAEDMSAQVCMLHGTGDGVPDATRGRPMTLSARARRLRQELGDKFGVRIYPAWTWD